MLIEFNHHIEGYTLKAEGDLSEVLDVLHLLLEGEVLTLEEALEDLRS